MTIFNPRRNSIGFLRLLFAATVILSHSWPLGGFGTDPGRVDNNLGFTAVEGFFALSGFLITSSGTRLGIGRFMWHRILRIFPGYWVALIVVAFGFAPIVWHTAHSLLTYLQTAPPAAGFVLNNWVLFLGQTSIAGTLSDLPFPNLWNGPLYTLLYEFMCYLIIALLMVGRMLTGRVVIILTAVSWVYLQLLELGVAGVVDDRQARLTLCFLVGSLIYLYRDKLLTASWWMPVGALVITVASYATIGFAAVGMLTFCYLCLWSASVLPLRGFGRKRDFSYGMYIYGWPVLQICTFFGLTHLGHLWYLVIVFAITTALAALSWYLVESRALKLKSWKVPQRFRSESQVENAPGLG